MCVARCVGERPVGTGVAEPPAVEEGVVGDDDRPTRGERPILASRWASAMAESCVESNAGTRGRALRSDEGADATMPDARWAAGVHGNVRHGTVRGRVSGLPLSGHAMRAMCLLIYVSAHGAVVGKPSASMAQYARSRIASTPCRVDGAFWGGTRALPPPPLLFRPPRNRFLAYFRHCLRVGHREGSFQRQAAGRKTRRPSLLARFEGPPRWPSPRRRHRHPRRVCKRPRRWMHR